MDDSEYERSNCNANTADNPAEPEAEREGYYSKAHQCGDHAARWYEIKEGVKQPDGSLKERHVFVCFATAGARVTQVAEELNAARERGIEEGMKRFASDFVKGSAQAEGEKAREYAQELREEAKEFEAESFGRAQEIGQRAATLLSRFGLEYGS